MSNSSYFVKRDESGWLLQEEQREEGDHDEGSDSG
jgi:hypothetical protein